MKFARHIFTENRIHSKLVQIIGKCLAGPCCACHNAYCIVFIIKRLNILTELLHCAVPRIKALNGKRGKMCNRCIKRASRKRIKIHCTVIRINILKLIKIKCEFINTLAKISAFKIPFNLLIHQLLLIIDLFLYFSAFADKQKLLGIIKNTIAVVCKRQILVITRQ